ncbi:MAG TPA: S8 family serine peptidase [Candidatus Cybelea sp.]|jgi:subtilase family serine protease
MKHLYLFLPGVAAGLLLAACGGGIPGPMEQSNTGGAAAAQRQAGPPGTPACPKTNSDEARCQLIIQKTGVQADVAGWGPADLQAAYNLPSSSNGSGQIVAIVDAYDNPNVASDLAEYRSHFGLPPANFTKYNEAGQTDNYPKSCNNAKIAHWGWCVEIDLDVEVVSAVCPNCTIYLVEAKDNNRLDTAEARAVKLGAHIVTNSWGWSRKISVSDFDTKGVVYLAAAGDSNYGSSVPAELANVVSVGGTILAKRGSKYKEIVWPWTGGGCDLPFAKPAWQHDPDCKYRMANDVAAVADDFAEYDTYASETGWLTVGGTSVASPLIASVYALAGNASSQQGGKELWTLPTEQRKKYLHAITEGSDGRCGGSYFCTAGTGQYGTYSGPGGWGSPNGIGAF